MCGGMVDELHDLVLFAGIFGKTYCRGPHADLDIERTFALGSDFMT